MASVLSILIADIGQLSRVASSSRAFHGPDGSKTDSRSSSSWKAPGAAWTHCATPAQVVIDHGPHPRSGHRGCRLASAT